MAEKFGAVCTTQIDDEVTHVVALAPGTEKVCILPFDKSNVGNSQNIW